MKRTVIYAGSGLLAILILIQFIPFGRDHSNPSVNGEPEWDTPATRALARRACFDCHSNRTKWPWYSSIAPISWLVYHDVVAGRQHINFSDWGRPSEQHVDEFQEVFDENSMPPFYYVWLHPDAHLSPVEKEALREGLAQLAKGYQPP